MSKKLLTLLLTVSLALFLFMGCDDDNPTEPEPEINEFELVEAVGNTYFSNYVTASGKGVNIKIGDVFTNLTDGNTANDPYIIDWRKDVDFATGHLKGAVNMSIKDLLAKVEDGTIPTDKTILNVCYTGQTASHTTAILNLLGYEAQNLLFGMCGVTTSADINGTDKWVKAIETDEFGEQLVATQETLTDEYDFPTLSTGKTTAEEIIKARWQTYMDNIASWAIIGANDVFADPSKYFIVNYWPQSEYLDPGHIPGAYQMTPKTSLKADALLKYLPTDQEIVIYCYTGQTSAQIAAYLRVLGYEAYSLAYGVNGFGYQKLNAIGHQYKEPTNDYSSIITK